MFAFSSRCLLVLAVRLPLLSPRLAAPLVVCVGLFIYACGLVGSEQKRRQHGPTSSLGLGRNIQDPPTAAAAALPTGRLATMALILKGRLAAASWWAHKSVHTPWKGPPTNFVGRSVADTTVARSGERPHTAPTYPSTKPSARTFKLTPAGSDSPNKNAYRQAGRRRVKCCGLSAGRDDIEHTHRAMPPSSLRSSSALMLLSLLLAGGGRSGVGGGRASAFLLSSSSALSTTAAAGGAGGLGHHVGSRARVR